MLRKAYTGVLTSDTLVIHSTHMATTKKRLNITLSADTEAAVASLAKRDNVPAATKVSELLEQSLLLVEDEVLTDLGEARLASLPKKTRSHKSIWKS